MTSQSLWCSYTALVCWQRISESEWGLSRFLHQNSIVAQTATIRHHFRGVAPSTLVALFFALSAASNTTWAILIADRFGSSGAIQECSKGVATRQTNKLEIHKNVCFDVFLLGMIVVNYTYDVMPLQGVAGFEPISCEAWQALKALESRIVFITL